MRIFLLAMTTLSAVMFGSAALAQNGAPALSAEAARAEGERIIASAQVADLFENISDDDGMVRLRHKASGMVCIFVGGGQQNSIHIYPTSPRTTQRGDDVSCATFIDDTRLSLTSYATRYVPMPSIEEDMAMTINGVRRTRLNAKPLEGAFAVATVEGRPAPAFSAMTFEENGQEYASFAYITHLNEWSFKTRASTPKDKAEAASLLAGLIFNLGLPKD
ncbi:hypothetical protein [Brevundimonas nasdae]|uniref:hypothetical protein n=1 Tax=Brevundimonas nasdae TaxID=172043 RepID=UPI00289CEF16|nr:hypothetical protein [Brevundimonas nasdae]